MPKSRHRAPTACLRQWITWAVAALVAAAAFAVLAPIGGQMPVIWTFVLLLLCFATGSMAGSMLLSRPLRQDGHLVFSAVREPEAIEQAPVERPKSLPAPERPNTAPRTDETPAFATSDDLEVTVLVSGNDGSEQSGGELAGAGFADLSAAYVVPVIPAQQARDSVSEGETGADEPDSGPYPGAVKAKPNGKSPRSDYRVKGNARSKRYHTMQSPYYERTKASVWFRSAADAEAAGFSAWNSRTKNPL
ncbi:hypothetical protein [Saccharopolyspora flava]|uniref:Uncharacterized protein n=1 Tax=Saccharopolyspora flava TaxID=95161 RepID=A0A1I6UCP0_9PSEU|nr:hypothetical protein [Saccharopolyspora flava]SFS99171.1 hypothetical protein SAMN05660874_04780 [Saccharopolyspora flava]